MTDPTTPASPFIPNGLVPVDVGTTQMRMLSFDMSMTDDQIDAIAAKAKEIRDTYNAWQVFYDDLAARKKRLLGFRAVVEAMDINAAATAMQTSPQLVAAVMKANADTEEARIVELEALWNSGQLPDRPVLLDQSKQVITENPIAP